MKKINAYLSASCFDDEFDCEPLLFITFNNNEVNLVNQLFDKFKPIGVMGIKWEKWRRLLNLSDDCFNVNDYWLHGNHNDIKNKLIFSELRISDTKTGTYLLEYRINGDKFEKNVFVCAINNVENINDFLSYFKLNNEF